MALSLLPLGSVASHIIAWSPGGFAPPLVVSKRAQQVTKCVGGRYHNSQLQPMPCHVLYSELVEELSCCATQHKTQSGVLHRAVMQTNKETKSAH
jgi:hypothetical protein